MAGKFLIFQFDSAALAEMELKFTITDESEGCQWRGPGTDDSDYIFTVQPFETHKWELWKHAGFKLVFEYEIVSNTPVDLST